MNDADIDQLSGRAPGDGADFWQTIQSSGCKQRDRAQIHSSGRSAVGRYDVEQVNWTTDDDLSTNLPEMDQYSTDSWTDV